MWFILIFAILFSSIVPGATAMTDNCKSILHIHGGAVKLPVDEGEYYERFNIDYGVEDNRRMAGALRGFIKSGSLASLPQSDAFLQWLQTFTEEGSSNTKGRLKAYHAADFGSSRDLRPGENPKLIIVNRKLHADKEGKLGMPPIGDIDVEVREVWQPWLKSKCNFVVRYIVPDRVNIIKIMANQRRFTSELHMEDVKDDKSGKVIKKAWIAMTFKPTLLQRLTGKRSITINHNVDAEKLLDHRR